MTFRLKSKSGSIQQRHSIKNEFLWKFEWHFIHNCNFVFFCRDNFVDKREILSRLKKIIHSKNRKKRKQMTTSRYVQLFKQHFHIFFFETLFEWAAVKWVNKNAKERKKKRKKDRNDPNSGFFSVSWVLNASFPSQDWHFSKLRLLKKYFYFD